MTNDKILMTKEGRSPNDKWRQRHGVHFLHLSFEHSFVIRILSLVIFSLAALLWCGCVGPRGASPHEASPHLVGRISGNSYTSSWGHFSVPFPVSPEVGGRIIRDDSQSVTFHDNWGSKISFYSKSFNVQSPLMSVPQSEGRAKALETFMKDIYGNSIVPHYHPDVLDGTISFIYLKPVGPKTGVAAFINRNRVYLVETDLLPGVQMLSKEDDESQQAREEWLENRAVELLQSIEIR
jgi:hypothetical protein